MHPANQRIRRRIPRTDQTPAPAAGESEDCLNLNVFTPASASSTGSKAVLVWFYGGGFVYGATSVPLYDGTSFAANQDLVVVTVNYRTNVFGFPADSKIPVKERNVGLLDQRLALDWVHRNIAKLGGDPSKVTLVGESAGGSSVDALVVSPPHPVPFRAAIMESGQSTIKTPLDADPKTYTKSWKSLVHLAKCPSDDDAVECLRKLPARDLKHLVEKNSLAFGPVSDGGHTWAETPQLARQLSTDKISSIARVPVLIGSNADEDKPFAIGQNDTRKFLASNGIRGVYADMLLKAYPLGSPGAHTENDRISLIATDAFMHCPAQKYANLSAGVGIPTWRYFFNASFPNNEIFKGSGAYHSAEIQFVFGTYPQAKATPFERDVGRVMQTAWADFAKDPVKGPGWKQDPQVAVFGDGVKAGMSAEGRNALRVVDSGFMDRRCRLYQELYR
ncbi:hypothetical protein NUU61_000216 [Penicillium alfredii]|uniref:Carboxylesterase type B domain-containing protein n=1 Tax=Penicillium alfredii TaxID=1506179 RepID=A0A9W9GAF7_9EURO|nr:uncharacterized protein NUU61_000216 [Penicillium alfredii]KAJ5114457.1 hypothetical protein NUU61_000216 [Penicillium alfredii]